MAASLRLLDHPCANCARQIKAKTTRSVYCSDLCSQVAQWIRYYQRTSVDGRIDDPDVHEALGIKLAHIAAGGYAQRERRISDYIRQAVIQRDWGACQTCGQPGTDIDHIHDSSPDLSNLQLLCRPCHNIKTQQGMVRAEPDVIDTVHVPIQLRAVESPSRQPCDAVDWSNGEWITGAKAVGKRLRSAWFAWLSGPGAEPLNAAIAVTGFPPELEPWQWYSGSTATTTVVDLSGSDDAWRQHWPKDIKVTFDVGMMDETELRRKCGPEMAELLLASPDERRVIVDRMPDDPLVSHSLPFRQPVSGTGKWHVSYADAGVAEPPDWVVDPALTPACGSRTVQLDLEAQPVKPRPGSGRWEHEYKVCANCLRLT